ncbi:MAG: SMI1/KNR4 family protein [Dongiaceae bacterium]
MASLPDDLIQRIRARSADPLTRTDAPPSTHGQTVTVGPLSIAGIDLGALLRGERDVRPSPPDPNLPPPASDSALAGAAKQLGFPLPDELQQLLKIADGGFGPGAGLMSLAEIVGTYRDLLADAPGPRGQEWPRHLLPFTRTRPGHDCIDTRTGAIVVWDEEELADGVSDKVWKRSFKPDAPDLAAWFERWVGTASPAQKTQDMMQQAMLSGLRQTLAYWRAKTPQERAAFGLPETGWEQALFGHLGIDLSKL